MRHAIRVPVLLGVALVPTLVHAIPIRVVRGPDFNGDGYEDLAASRTADMGWPDESQMFLFWGSAGGLDVPPQLPTVIADGPLPGESGLGLGFWVDWGDFDGDCYDDLVIRDICNQGETPGDGLDWCNGVVHVLPGGPSGPSVSNVVSFDLETLGFDSTGKNHFGFSLAVGDFDGDLHDDLAVGAPMESLPGKLAAGVVAVLYGGPGGLDPTSPTSVQLLHRDLPGMLGPAVHHDYFGDPLAAGDFDCDGHDDLTIGIWGTHELQVIYGGSDGLDPQAGPSTQLWPTDSFGLRDAGRADFIATGNFDGLLAAGADGNSLPRACMDLAVGMPHAGAGRGAVVVMYGMPNEGLQISTTSLTILEATNWWLGLDPEAERFGTSLSVGRFDNQPYDDLAVSYDDGGVLLHGHVGGLTPVGNLDVFVGEHDDFRLPQVGYGDFDDDGAGDLVIGAPNDPEGPSCKPETDTCDAGQIQVNYLASTPNFTVDDVEVWSSYDVPGQQAGDHENLGYSVTVGRSVFRPQCMPLDFSGVP